MAHRDPRRIAGLPRSLSLALTLALPICASLPEPVEARRSASVLRQAKRKFDQAEVNYRLGNFDKALGLYKHALRLARRPSIVFNIAQCYRFLEQSKRAIFFYELYLSEWKRSHPGTPPPNLEEVRSHLAKLRRDAARPKHGSLRLRGVPPGATVLVDGMIVGKGPLSTALKLEPGARQVRVEAPGYLPATLSVEVAGGATVSKQIALQPTSRPRSKAWLVTGISAAALAVGAEVAALVLTKKTNEEITGSDGFKRYRNLAITSHVVAGSMAVLSGVGFYLWYRSGKGGPREETGTALTVVPLPEGGALIGGAGRF